MRNRFGIVMILALLFCFLAVGVGVADADLIVNTSNSPYNIDQNSNWDNVTVEAECKLNIATGVELTVSGNFTNNGTLTLEGSATLKEGDEYLYKFTNNGSIQMSKDAKIFAAYKFQVQENSILAGGTTNATIISLGKGDITLGDGESPTAIYGKIGAQDYVSGDPPPKHSPSRTRCRCIPYHQILPLFQRQIYRQSRSATMFPSMGKYRMEIVRGRLPLETNLPLVKTVSFLSLMLSHLPLPLVIMQNF